MTIMTYTVKTILFNIVAVYLAMLASVLLATLLIFVTPGAGQ